MLDRLVEWLWVGDIKITITQFNYIGSHTLCTGTVMKTFLKPLSS